MTFLDCEVLSKSTTPIGKLVGSPSFIKVVKKKRQKIGATIMQKTYRGLETSRLNSLLETSVNA